MSQQIKYNQSDLVDHIGIWLWIENKYEKIYMLYHNKFDTWTIPLEKSEPNESVHDAIVRSGTEEVGIEIIDYQIMHEQFNEYERNGIQVKVKGILVKVLHYNGNPQNLEPHKHSQSDWKSKDFIKGLKTEMHAVMALQQYI